MFVLVKLKRKIKNISAQVDRCAARFPPGRHFPLPPGLQKPKVREAHPAARPPAGSIGLTGRQAEPVYCQAARRALSFRGFALRSRTAENPRKTPSYGSGSSPQPGGLAAFWLLFRRRKSNRGSGAAKAPRPSSRRTPKDNSPRGQPPPAPAAQPPQNPHRGDKPPPAGRGSSSPPGGRPSLPPGERPPSGG